MLDAVAQIALDDGLGAVTIDEVARRSGVAKTTVYRHFPTKPELLVAALDQLVGPPVAPDTGSLVGDLTAFLRSVHPIFADDRVREQVERWSAQIRDATAEAAETHPGEAISVAAWEASVDALLDSLEVARAEAAA